MRMIFIKKQFIWIIIITGLVSAGDLPSNWEEYWIKSCKTVMTNQFNQKILGIAALAALGATQIDMKVKTYAQTRGLLSKPVSHFGDYYGGAWGHWVLWSSILTSSIMNNEGKENIISKMQFSTFAMLTNGIVTYGMKRSFGRERPNGSCCQSFPSGHTSHSFTIAAIAHELYGESVGILAYGLATLVAVSRINDNKHYLSDVLFGAALGSTVGRAFALNYNEIEDNIVITPYMQLKFTFPL